MIKTIEFRNYKGFGAVSLSDLKVVNVITGDNGSGKTSLLEAFLIAAKGNPEGVLRLNRTRGLPDFSALVNIGFSSTITPDAFRNMFSHMFTDLSEAVDFSYATSEDRKRELSIYFSKETATATPLLSSNIMEDSVVSPVMFERRDSVGLLNNIPTTLTSHGQLNFRPSNDFGPLTYYFSSLAPYSEGDNVSWLSNLKLTRGAASVIKAITEEFPIIKHLEILSPNGVQAIYATLDNDDTRPLSLISSGVNKMLGIYLGASAITDGIILVDEIENGIFYEKYASIWRNIYKICKKNRNQLFVSSHSSECLSYLSEVIKGNEDDFTLLRTERENGKCVIRHISGKSMGSALRRSDEIRGTTIETEGNN